MGALIHFFSDNPHKVLRNTIINLTSEMKKIRLKELE